MNLVPYDPALHYPHLVAGWLGHAHEPEAPEALPGGGRPGFGVLAFERDAQGAEVWLACGFVYETGTTLWIGPHYLMVNPALHGMEGGKAIGDQALDAVVTALEIQVAAAGGGALGTFSDQPAVIARARRMGYALRGRIPLLGKWVAPAPAAEAVEPQAEGSGNE